MRTYTVHRERKRFRASCFSHNEIILCVLFIYSMCFYVDINCVALPSSADPSCACFFSLPFGGQDSL